MMSVLGFKIRDYGLLVIRTVVQADISLRTYPGMRTISTQYELG